MDRSFCRFCRALRKVLSRILRVKSHLAICSPEWKQRCLPDYLRELLWVPAQRSSAEEANALPGGPTAASRPRCQGRGVVVHWSEAETLDGRSGRIRRRLRAGRAGDTVSLCKKILRLAFESEAIFEDEGGILRPHADWARAMTCSLAVASV